MSNINILISIDKNYIFPFKVMLQSLLHNNPRKNITFYLLHSAIPKEDLEELSEYSRRHGVILENIQVDKNLFQNAPISKRYPQEIYYRLLSSHILPQSLERILYLDLDILIINSLEKLWNMDLGEYVFAAAAHTGITEITNGINRIRLGTKHDYFNSGVILMDLAKARKIVNIEEVFQYIKNHQNGLLLPDQDIFNVLYGKKTLPIEDAVWNYDVRNYFNYLIRSNGKYNLDWVMENTSILHFCGSSKPWQSSYGHRFLVLYKHYMNITKR